MLGAATAALPLGIAFADPSLIEPYSPELQARLFNGPSPLTVRFAGRAGSVVFVGAAHSTDRTGPTFTMIERAARRFRPGRWIVEGFPSTWGDSPARIAGLVATRDRPDADSYSRGEAVHAVSLALASGRPFQGGEPDARSLFESQLAAGADVDDIVGIDLIKALGQDREAGVFTSGKDAGFTPAFRNWSQAIGRDIGRPPMTADAFRAWYQTRFQVAFDDDPDWTARADPGQPGLGASIARTQSLLRDRHLLGVIEAAVQKDRTIAVVYGSGHLATLWAALARAIGPARRVL